jgi:hypothetical protein
MLFDEEPEFSVKSIATKSYIRITDDGVPQLIRVGPVVDDMGIIDHDMAALYVDEEEPRIIPRFTIEPMLNATECVPLEVVAHWKHTKVN